MFNSFGNNKDASLLTNFTQGVEKFVKTIKLKRLLLTLFERNEKHKSLHITLANNFFKKWSVFNKQIGETNMIIVQAPEIASTMPDFIRKPKRNPNNKFPEEFKDLIDKQCGAD